MAVRALEVRLHGVRVGRVQEGTGGASVFRIDEGYAGAVPRWVLSQSFEDDPSRRSYVARHGLPAFFANLVPEGSLRRILERSTGTRAGDDLALLGAVGDDLPGAVTLSPLDEDAPELEVDALHEKTPPPPGAEVRGLYFSLAGVQLKFSVVRADAKLVLPARGQSGEWIAKLPSSDFSHLARNEHAMLTWARDAGFDVPEALVLPTAALEGVPKSHTGDAAELLLVRRYDRRADARVHQEDFAQLAGLRPDLKYDQLTYDQLVRLVRGLMGLDAALELIRRITFVVATGNNDAHLKNWSVIYPDRVHPQLAPLYDQVSTVAWPQLDRRLALKLAGRKEFGSIDMGAFRQVAQKAGLDRGEVELAVKDTVRRLAETWPGIVDLLPEAQRVALEAHWRSVLLLSSLAPRGLV